MPVPKSLTAPIADIAPADIPATIDALIAEGTDLVTHSDGDLSPADAETFAHIERSVSILNMRAPQGHGSFSNGRTIESMFNDDDAPEQFRAPGQLPLPSFTEDQYRQFHADLVAGHPTPIATDLDTYAAATAVPMATIPGQRLDPVAYDREITRIADILPTDTTEAAKVTFYTESSAAAGAAAVAEGAAKPESTPGWTPTTIDIRKIAHYTDISTEALDDYSNMRQVLGDSMTAGLIATENAQLISGSGTAPNIRGLLNTSGILTYAPGAAEARWLSIRTAIRNLRKGAGFANADVLVIHPDDEQLFDITNASSAGLHAVPDLNSSVTAPAWGLKRIVTTGITAGTGLIMDSRRAAVLYVRQAPTLIADPYSQSVNNVVRVIVEERIGLAVIDPACIIKLTYNGSA